MFPALCESACIAAAAAQFLRRVAAGKAVVYSPGAFAAQNFIQRAFKEIAEGDITLMVKTAGHNSSVTEDAYLVAQTASGLSRGKSSTGRI